MSGRRNVRRDQSCDCSTDEAGRYAIWVRHTCADPSLCRIGQSQSGLEAFCAVEATPDDRCASATQTVCSGSELVTCREGYVIQQQVCTDCSNGCCQGGWGSRCTDTSECASGLECAPLPAAPNGPLKCYRRCDCPEGARCAACDEYYRDDNSPLVCKSGWCEYTTW